MHFKPSHNEMMSVLSIAESFSKGKKGNFLQMLMVTLLRGMPVELENIYCFLLFWGVGGARKKTILYINESCRTSHTQDYQGPISLSNRNGILAPNTGCRSKILDCLYRRSYALWSTTDISLRSPSWVGSCWIPGK